MDARPLCPLVLSLLAVEPQRAQDIARALTCVAPSTEAEGYPAVVETLDRLRDGGLVRRRAAPAGPLYQLTRRGRAELRLQRLLWARLARAAA